MFGPHDEQCDPNGGCQNPPGPCLNWEAVLRSMFLLIEVFHWTPLLAQVTSRPQGLA